jgi:hypothetical protein
LRDDVVASPPAVHGVRVSAATCWRRLAEWHDAGVCRRLHRTCWLSCTRLACWTWRTRWWTPHTYVPATGGPHRPEPGRPGPAGQQAPPDHRRHPHPPDGDPDRRPPQRRHPIAATPGRNPTDPRPARPTAATTTAPTVSCWVSGHHPGHRPPRHRARLRPGPVALGRGTHLGLAACLPTASHPLRTRRRHPPSHDQPRVLDQLPPEAAHRALTGQPKNPTRVCTNHSGSSSQG